MDDLYNPEITDLEANEYHGNPRPVVYLDEAKVYCDKQSIGARIEAYKHIRYSDNGMEEPLKSWLDGYIANLEQPEKRVKVVNPDECWWWAGPMNGGGYGIIRVEGRYRPAHTTIYEALVGLIPEGLEPDHLCRNRACVNPDHLEPVTHQENARRGMSLKRQTHCKRGHELKEGNLSYNKNPYGTIRRQCLTCKKDWGKRNPKLESAPKGDKK